MAALGTVLLWIFAILGMFFVAGVIWTMITDGGEEQAKVEAPKPQPQIVNIRPVAPPTPVAEPQVLQKTTMQITTTKYVEPNAGKKELSA